MARAQRIVQGIRFCAVCHMVVYVKKLTDLPNIGKVVADQLYAAGIESDEDLKQIGSKKAWLLIQESDPSACYNRLCGLEGAIEGIRWHHLSDEKKADLKAFYEEHTKWGK